MTNQPTPTPDELVARVRAGDETAFGELFEPHREAVGRVCRRLMGDARWEDAAQEIFLRTRRGLPGYDGSRPFRPWVVAIASNYCLDLLRRGRTESLIFSPGELEPASLESPGLSPLGQLVVRERRSAALDAVDSLPRKYRVPLVLRFFHELDYEAIGEILEITPNQVGTLLFRAKQKLRDRTKHLQDARAREDRQ